MLWGEVTRQTDTTLLGQTLYSLEAEAIAEYWFDKYGTTYPEAFDVESVGMVWGDGATHATWFSAEVEMIKAINFLPFHGGSLYLSEMARDGEAVIDEITELNGGPPDVWQSLISQYEALVNPVEAWNEFLARREGTAGRGTKPCVHLLLDGHARQPREHPPRPFVAITRFQPCSKMEKRTPTRPTTPEAKPSQSRFNDGVSLYRWSPEPPGQPPAVRAIRSIHHRPPRRSACTAHHRSSVRSR